MKRATRIAIALTVILFLSTSPLLSERVYWYNRIYWNSAVVDTTSIQRAYVDGYDLQTILSCTTGCGLGPLALDTVGQRIYYVQIDDAGLVVYRARLDGTDPETFLVLESRYMPVEDLAVDPVGRVLYYAIDMDGSAGSIRRIALDGSDESVVFGATGRVRGLDVDPGGKLYWSESLPTSGYALRRANLDGSNLEDLAIGAVEILDITLDLGSGKLYWLAGEEIHRASLDGSDPSTLPVSLTAPTSIAFDSYLDLLYVTLVPVQFSGTILSVDPATAATIEILDDLGAVSEIAFDPPPQDVPATSPWTLVLTVLLLLGVPAWFLVRRGRLKSGVR